MIEYWGTRVVLTVCLWSLEVWGFGWPFNWVHTLCLVSNKTWQIVPLMYSIGVLPFTPILSICSQKNIKEWVFGLTVLLNAFTLCCWSLRSLSRKKIKIKRVAFYLNVFQGVFKFKSDLLSVLWLSHIFSMWDWRYIFTVWGSYRLVAVWWLLPVNAWTWSNCTYFTSLQVSNVLLLELCIEVTC